MKYKVGEKVLSLEHPKAIGTVVREMPAGLVIEFTTPANESLPFGHIATEFWPESDLEQLILVTEQGQ